MYKTQGIANTRIEIADALRGIAVMGIILYHSLENFNLFYPDKDMLLPCDTWIGNLCEVLFAGKMYGIFALLFGLSFFIMRDNQEQKGHDFSLRFAWRMLLLFLIGVLNMFFYNGDILTFYALLGLLMIPAAYLPTHWLWALTIFLLMQPIEIYNMLIGSEISTDELWMTYGKMGEANQEGTFLESCIANMHYGLKANLWWFLWKGRITQTYAFFLLGILLGRIRLFYNEGNNLQIWTKVLCFSLPFALLGLCCNLLPSALTCMFILFTEVSGIVLLWYRSDAFQSLLSNVCFFGRMSLSNYLLQSLFGSLIFYGWGLGLCKHFGVTWSVLTGIGIITVQILILKVWNRHHQRGPVESLWRKATWINLHI